MRCNARFWRNVALIALIHIAAVLALLRWAGISKDARAEEITWLNTSGELSAAAADTPKAEETPTPEPKPELTPKEEAVSMSGKSEIQLPGATPHPTPSPSATPKPSAKPSPKPSPKKKASPKPSATPEKKKSPARATSARENTRKSAPKRDEPKRFESKSGETTVNRGSASVRPQGDSGPTNASWYGNMLHDRFYREWAQPTTVVASGAKLSALARIRIEKDGRVSDFKIVRSSGNMVVDESVEAVGKRVTRVDALPGGIGSGGHYDVNINFALNSK